MKCPQCERWNRATLEKCFYCGVPLPQPDAQSASIWRSENSDVPKPPATVIYWVENADRTVPLSVSYFTSISPSTLSGSGDTVK